MLTPTPRPSPLPLSLNLEPLGADGTVEALVERAFRANPTAVEPGRLATRLRAGATALDGLCLAVRQGGTLRASLQSWPVTLEAGLSRMSLVLIGPVAVEPEWHDRGLGGALMTAAVARLDRAAVLVGDPGYYGRWGFTADATRRWRVDGEVERDRLLIRKTVEPLPREGWLRAAGREWGRD